MTEETTEEFAPFWVRELRETWLKNVVSACAMFMRIEDFILELEDLERMTFEGHHMTKARELKSRLNTLQLRFREANAQTQSVIDRSLLDVNFLMIALTVYRRKLKEANIGDRDEQEAAKATFLHASSIGKRAKAREREAKREALKRERELRTGRSYSSRRQSGKDETS